MKLYRRSKFEIIGDRALQVAVLSVAMGVVLAACGIKVHAEPVREPAVVECMTDIECVELNPGIEF